MTRKGEWGGIEMGGLRGSRDPEVDAKIRDLAYSKFAAKSWHGGMTNHTMQKYQLPFCSPGENDCISLYELKYLSLQLYRRYDFENRIANTQFRESNGFSRESHNRIIVLCPFSFNFPSHTIHNCHSKFYKLYENKLFGVLVLKR